MLFIYLLLFLFFVILVLSLIVIDLFYKNILLTNHNYDLISEIYFLKEHL